MPRTRPPSMSDVAAAAGVSHQTVSRVLNGHAYVRQDTRERVLAAIETLGYRRNQAARALVTARTGVLGVMTAGTTQFGIASAVLAIERAARASGFFVSLASLAAPDSEGAARVLDRLMDQGIDGVVVIAPTRDIALLIDGIALPVPVVVVAARGDAPGAGAARYVSIDQRAGAAAATRHLRERGHERIAHVQGEDDWFDAIERAGGYADAMRAAGAPPRILRAGGWSARHGHAVGVRLADEVRDGAVTAVFCANDYLAIGVVHALAEAGLHVPDDASVVGFDDIDGSAHLLPPLTTVRQPFERLADEVVRAIAGGEDGRGAVAPELIVRGSTAPPPGAASARRV